MDHMVPESLDDLVPTADAATMCGVDQSTISAWKRRGHLKPTGLDEQGRPLYKRIDVLRAAKATRQRALGESRIS